MRILMITSSAPFGKGESFVISEANAIAALGHDVVLVPTLTRRGNVNKFVLHDKINILAWPLLNFLVIYHFLLAMVVTPSVVFNMFRVVHDKKILNTLKNYLVIPKAIRLARYLEIHPVDHIHAHWLTTPSTLAMLVSWVTGISWSATAHRGDIVSNNALERKFKSAKFIRFISESGRRLADERVDLTMGNVKVLHLGIDLSKLVDSSSLLRTRELKFFNIICPANLIPVKGHSTLIKAIAKMKYRGKIRVFIVGDGYLRQGLEKEVKELGLEGVINFCGHIPHSRLLRWYKTKRINLVVLPSLDLGDGVHEGIPVSLMEAMAFFIPVISTRTGGIPELLEEGGQLFGGLVEPGNPYALAKLLDRFVRFPQISRNLQACSYQRIETAFNQSSIVPKLLELMN